MAAKMSIHTKSGTVAVVASDRWRREGNVLIIDHADKKDDQGRPVLVAQFPDWAGFVVEYE
jgi:hypothetical protein